MISQHDLTVFHKASCDVTECSASSNFNSPPSMLNVAAIRWLWRTAFQHKHTSKDFYGQMQNRSISIFWPYCSSRGKSLNEVGREKKNYCLLHNTKLIFLLALEHARTNPSLSYHACSSKQQRAHWESLLSGGNVKPHVKQLTARLFICPCLHVQLFWWITGINEFRLPVEHLRRI